MIDKVQGNRIANDINFYLVELFKAVQDGWIPPNHITEREYTEIKANKEKFSPQLVGFAGFGCSYSGKWFSTYARGNSNNGSARNYTEESKKNILKQVKNIKGISIQNQNYHELKIPEKSIIYCDPPYAGVAKYQDKFNTEMFWEWVRKINYQGHTVYISEYNAPFDFVCVWEKVVNSALSAVDKSKKSTEKLFRPRFGPHDELF